MVEPRERRTTYHYPRLANLIEDNHRPPRSLGDRIGLVPHCLVNETHVSTPRIVVQLLLLTGNGAAVPERQTTACTSERASEASVSGFEQRGSRRSSLS